MSDFDDARAGLAAARDAQAERRGALVGARTELRRAEAAAAAARRSLPPDAPEHDELQRAVAEAGGAVASAGKDLLTAREQLGAAITQFAVFSDPREELSRLPDSHPILLFPLRLETRFRTDLDQPELWVRVFPDTCLVDTFEPTLAAVEVESAKRYWKGIWRARGVEDDERGAWRGLVEAHGSGRAGWIADAYRPANEAERPVRPESEIVLVIALEAPLPAAEADAVADFWCAVWRATGDATDAEAARAALTAEVGAARAEELEKTTAPYNLGDGPEKRQERALVAVSAAFVILPAPSAVQDQPWSRAPHVDLLPDRLVLIAEQGTQRVERVGEPVRSPLIVGPDPLAKQDEALRPDGEDLRTPDELEWMVDFDRAFTDGLAFRIRLSPAQAQRGFDRLMVLGARMSADADQGGGELEALLAAHHSGRSGLSLLAQGTPTNNTEQAGSGYTRSDDPDASFDARRDAPLFTVEADPRRRRDGQWLAERLGIAPETLVAVPGAGGADQLEARAMQSALWPATMGYFLDTAMEPVISAADVDHARWFFTEHVRGRGGLPALRIGAQPYGILPTTAFSRIGWLRQRGAGTVVLGSSGSARPGFLARLHQLLMRIQDDWAPMAERAPVAGTGPDPHATLLGILGLHPASVEFQLRYAQSIEHLYNHLNLFGLGSALSAAVRRQLDAEALSLLASLGHDGEQRPAVLDRYFLGRAQALTGPLVDDPPPSETRPVRPTTTDGRNYLRWLADAARVSLDAVRLQQGFVENAPPRALLYLLLRHALMLGYEDAGRRMYRSAGFEDAVVEAMRREPATVHVGDGQESESRLAPLYRHEAAISPGESWTVAAHIASRLGDGTDTLALREQVRSVERLADVPTARLERLLAEHVDCCSYRFDAWRLGFVDLQLDLMRASEGAARGVHLGAYGWLEDVRLERRSLTPVRLDEPDLAATFTPDVEPVLRRDSSNGGFIHAPSQNHAVTAAVLRSAYLAGAGPDDPAALSVNLSSERVRVALDMLEGMRQGQSVGELLGYRLERGLHDRHGPVEVDRFIYGLRRAFPLRANRLRSTAVEGVAIDRIEARNVVDGRRLVEHLQRTGVTTYPFGLTTLPADATGPERDAVAEEVTALLDVNDALGDLALAEAVHQSVQGNADRAAATLQTFTTGQHPPDPDVTRTPATGVTLTHRVGLHLRPGLPAPAGATPRAIAEPAVDDWAARLLPDLATVGCRVRWTDPVSAAEQTLDVTLGDLGLRPIDVVELVRPAEPGAMAEVDDRVLSHWRATATPRPDVEPAIEYLEAGGAAFSVLEVAALAGSLRSVLVAARPLRPSDAAPPTEADERMDATATVDPARITAVRTLADTLAGDAEAYVAALGLLLDDQPARRGDVLATIDQRLDDAAALLDRGARLAVPQSAWGFAVTWRRERYAALVARLRERVAAFDARLAAFDALVGEYDALPAPTPDDERFALLQRAESALSPTVLASLPASPATLRTSLDALRTSFAGRRGELAAIAEGALPGLADLLSATAAALPLDDVDAEPFSLTDDEDAVIAFARDMRGAITSLAAEARRRVTAAQAALDAHAAAAEPPARVQALQDAAHALLGDGFVLVPEFKLSAEHGAEWQQALDASESGALLAHLATETEIEFPVDEWFAGVARVRPAMRHLERAGLLAGALGADEPALAPIQLPHVPDEGWFGLDLPAGTSIDGERLLYTAAYPAPFAPAGAQCGLLVDQWTEVVPGTTAATGLTFHYDRPNSEAPQAMLLVTPASMDGAWRWDDLTGAVEETMALAKLRAIEPEQIDDSAYARFLPATIMAATRRGIALATALAINNGVADRLRAGG